EIEIEVDRVPKSLTLRTSPIRIVERKKPRLRLLVADIAGFALKPLRKAKPCGAGAPARDSVGLLGTWLLEDNLTSLPISSLNGIHDARSSVSRNSESIDEDKHRLSKVNVEQRLRSREFKDLTVLIKPVKPCLPQIKKPSLQ